MSVSKNRENLTLVLALSRSYQQFFRVITPVFKQAGLTPSQWDILETLSNKGPMTVNDLLECALSTSGNLDVVLKNLIKAGLVTKTVAESDRRSRVVSLTKAGKRKFDEFSPVHNRVLDAIFQKIPLSEKRQLITRLNRLRKQIMPMAKEINQR